MQTVNFPSSSSSPRLPIFPPPIQNPPPFPRALGPLRGARRARPAAALFSVPRRRDHGGESVDEDLVTLRKRIREMRDAERAGADDDGDGDGDGDGESLQPPPSSEWTEWERQYYQEAYISDVCEFAGLIQTVLMNTRPGVAVGSVALIALCVPTALILIAARLAEASGPLISSALMHLN